ncbi:hypothetical protein QVD17_15039 [Tagetes erecta]|uniref:Uncharacterized protein n=1 Tax=Tagetes erecta TaxID=13708 RepID=A0AAD8KRN7_TARER|nr:hypothetical protein QVD17_15039 [Tagetes erecta]
MSRCFTFPPPGYEKKPVIDDPALLKKEKRREKKHKKDKKDKEKKDGKEKKEKHRGEGKHKEKKDKHRDKKKDKEKSETSTPDEKNIHGRFKGYNGERLIHSNEQNKEKINPTDGKKPSIQFPHQNGNLVGNKIMAGDPENFKFVQELDRRIRNEEKGMGSHQFLVEGRKNSFNKVEMQKTDRRHVVMDVAGFSGGVVIPNRVNGATPPPLYSKSIEKMQEKGSDGKWKNEDLDKQKQGKDKEMEKERKLEKLKEKGEQKKAERAKSKHIMKNDLVAVANNPSTHPLENGFVGVGNEGSLKKRKNMEINGVSHENEFRPNKMARPIPHISPENGRKLDFSHSPSPSLLDKQGALQNSLKVGSKGGQRVNGTITSQPVSVPAKKPPVAAFNHIPSKPSPIKSPPVITNHVAAQSPPAPTTKPQPNHIAALPSTPKPPPSILSPLASHHQPPPISPSPPPPAAAALPPLARPKPPPAAVNKVPPPPLPIPKKKPPHPDTKYLNQILAVPRPDQWCSFDDQEWLLSSKARPTSKKPPINEPEVQVWSEARHIVSADVCALPYVIPY